MAIKCVCRLRYLIAVMILFSTFVNYMLRVDISITLVDMVLPQKKDGKLVIGECLVNQNGTAESDAKKKDLSNRLDWPNDVQGYFLSAYYIGNILFSFPGGIISEKLGPSRCVFATHVLAGLLTGILPLLARYPFIITAINRFLVGSLGALTYPAAQVLIAHWSPPNEKGIFIALMVAGGTLATVVTWPVLGIVVENWLWPWGFYVPGLVTAVWAVFWILLVRDYPEDHKYISQNEVAFIKEAQGESILNKKKKVPYKAIFTSKAVWALIIAQFGNLWGLLLWSSILPKFEAEALGFKISKAGLVGMAPTFLRMTMGFAFAALGDWLVKSGRRSKLFVRKFFVIFSHILPGIFLLLLSFVGCAKEVVIIFIVFSLGLNGSICITHLQNAQDIAPNYVGTIYGIANSIGGITGLITPNMATAITKGSGALIRWHIVFWAGAAVYLVTGIVFILFAQVTVQPWNNPDQVEENAQQVAEETERK